MKLYEVTNGYLGDAYIRVYVIAVDEEQAKDKAAIKLKQESREMGRLRSNGHLYPDAFWTKLKAKLLCSDVNKGFVSEVIG